jgi:hypothetical protein
MDGVPGIHDIFQEWAMNKEENAAPDTIAMFCVHGNAYNDTEDLKRLEVMIL